MPEPLRIVVDDIMCLVSSASFRTGWIAEGLVGASTKVVTARAIDFAIEKADAIVHANVTFRTTEGILASRATARERFARFDIARSIIIACGSRVICHYGLVCAIG